MEQTTLTGTASYSETITNSKGQQRRTAHHISLDVPLRSVTSKQAPVAALVSGNREFRASRPNQNGEIRTLEGQLYKQSFDVQGQPLKPGSEHLDHYLSLSFSGNWGLEKAEASIRRGLGKYVVIDGEIWKQVVEPVILIGAGANSLTITRGDGNHQGAHAVFALTELDAAKKAQHAFDSQHGLKSKTAPSVEILIPSAFTMATSAERVQAARDTADLAVAAAVANLWMNRSASSIREQGLALMNIASDMATQTGEPLFGTTGAGDV